MVNGFNHNEVDTMNPHNLVNWDKKLTPKKYEIKGTDPNSKIFFSDVNIIDSTGKQPFRGDVYIEGQHFCLSTYNDYSYSMQVSESSRLVRFLESNRSYKTQASEKLKVVAGHL